MKALVPFILLFCLIGRSHAHAQDAFDLLFGAEPEPVDASQEVATGQDDLLLVGLRLRGLKLANAIPAYETLDDICLPFAILAELLEIDAEISESHISGWYVVPNRRFEIDIKNNKVDLSSGILSVSDADLTMSEDGVCASLSFLSKLLPIDFTHQSSTLSVRAEPRETLPLEARLEREAIREAALSGRGDAEAVYPLVDNPYRWISAPVVDVGFDLKAARGVDLQPTFSLDASGDILKMTGRVRASGRAVTLTENLHMSLERRSPEKDLLGPLRARSIRMGDISSAGTPMLAGGQTGRGISVSNRPLYAPDYFDMTTIRGPLMTGWEAELYRGEQLINFTDTPTSSGEYLFENVALMPGYNRLVVRLYGPFGEIEERVIKQFVGADLIPENEFEYYLALVDGGTSVLGETNRASALDTDKKSERSGLSVRVDYGLSQTVTLRSDALIASDDNPSGVAIAAAAGSGQTYGIARIAADSDGHWGGELAVQRRISDITSGSLKLRHFGALSSDIAGAGPSRISKSIEARFDTQWQIRGQSVPVQINAALQQTVEGRTQSLVNLRTSGQNFGTRWSHTLNWRNSSDTRADNESGFNGSLLLSRRAGEFRFKGGLDYDLSEGFTPRNAFVSAQTRLTDRTLVQGGLTYDMSSGVSRADAIWSQDFDRFTLSGNISTSSDQNWSAGFKLGFSLYKPKNTGYRITAPGMGRSGALRLQAFDDVNDNGYRDTSEAGMGGTKYIVGNVLRSEFANSTGITTLGNVELYRNVNVELQQSSLEDPFMRPVSRGFSVRLRPGQVLSVPVPVTVSADVDGMLYVRNGEETVPVSGVIIQAVDEKGRVLAESKTEYDGYYYLDGLPAKPVQIRIEPENLMSVKGRSNSETIILTRESPSSSGVNLYIHLEDLD